MAKGRFSVTLMLSAEELERIKALAAKAGLTPHGWLVAIVRARLGKEK